MSAKLILRGEEFEVKGGMTLRDCLIKIDVIPESVLATRNGDLLTDEQIVRDGETIKLIKVISGG